MFGFRERLENPRWQDWSSFIKALETQEPFHEPGTSQGYHALTYGFLNGELFRKVTGQTIGSYLKEHIADPFDLNFKIGLVEDQQKRLKEKSIASDIIDINEIKKIDNNCFLYPCVGENLDYLNIQGLNNFKFLYRNLDQTAWKYCNKGFFNFKKYIPNFIGEFFK